jgi:hypothetical protein
MMASKIMVVRHAEKPDDAGTISGVDIDGNQNRDELTVRGWQRAGALVRFFAPVDGHFRDQRIETPGTIFASRVAPHSKSLRSQHTVAPLAEIIGREKLRLDFAEGQEEELVAAAVAADGVVLISWHHGAISVTTLLPEHGTGTGSISCGSSLERRQAGVSSRFSNFSSREIGQTPLGRSHRSRPDQ